MPVNRFSIVLSGGGARGAYQAGSLRALFEIGKSIGNLKPFETIVGLSAGAVNASFLAAEADDLDAATDRLCQMWKNLHTSDVIRIDPFSLTNTGFKILRQLSLGGLSHWLHDEKLALLNTAPLAKLLSERIPFKKISQNIAEKKLHALCVSATDYSTSLGVTFFNGTDEIQPWQRFHRIGIRSEINCSHVMASSAIPLFFPPQSVEGRYFGDGCLRNTAPLAPAIHCGASHIIVLGARRFNAVDALSPLNNIKPSIGRVLSVLINAILMDGIEVDIERIKIINKAMESAPSASGFREISVFYSQPSKPLSDIAIKYADSLPPILKFLIGGLGSPKESAEIISYLAFEPDFERTLVDMGYNDIMDQRAQVTKFLSH